MKRLQNLSRRLLMIRLERVPRAVDDATEFLEPTGLFDGQTLGGRLPKTLPKTRAKTLPKTMVLAAGPRTS
jgi:hypothetical protein